MERLQYQESDVNQVIPIISLPAIKFIRYGRDLYVQMNLKSYILTPDKKLSLHQGFLFKVETKALVLPKIESDSDRGEIPLSSVLRIKIRKKHKPEISLVGDFPCLFHPHFTEPKFLSGILSDGKSKWVDYMKILVGDFPCLFHPHFTEPKFLSGILSDGKSKWVDYMKIEEFEPDIGSYLLRVAKSLIYDKEYINPNALNVANPKALELYQSHCYSESRLFPTDNVQFSLTGSSEYPEPEVIAKPKFLLNPSQQPTASPKKVKFEVKEAKPAYAPALRKKSDLQTVNSLNSNFRRESDFSLGYEFYLTMSAFKTIKDHIGWGNSTHENRVEQGGILLGHAYRNPDTNVVYAIAEQAISGRLARGSAGYLEVTHETWKEMLDDMDNLHTGLQLIGWYHTHPNTLDVFMSGTDRTTQQRLFGNDWQFAIVLNPHKRIWRAFYGSNSSECRGYVLDGNTYNDWR
jgi:proteasome lid subunit RPN8/RPN11